jgi:hypothetical protein
MTGEVLRPAKLREAGMGRAQLARIRDLSRPAFSRLGNGDAYPWTGPAAEPVGVYVSASPRACRDYLLIHSDRFVNAVRAAIVD